MLQGTGLCDFFYEAGGFFLAIGEGRVSIKANSYLQTEAALYLYCDVLDKRGLLATTPEGA